ARTRRRGVADDTELLFPQALDLQPLTSPARPVGRITALRDDAFQPQATGQSVEGRTMTLDMVAVLDHITRQAAKHRLQQGLPLIDRLPRPDDAIQTDDIERHEPEATRRTARLQVPPGREARPAPQQRSDSGPSSPCRSW